MAKSKKPARADRQKVIDDIRRKQKRSENRQGMVIIAVSVAIALAIIVAAAWNPVSSWLRKETISADSLTEIGAAPSVCQDVVTREQEGNQHVDQGRQVTYASAPPATGDHWNVRNIAPVPITQRFYDAEDRPELEQLVHNSEHGYTILWYDESRVGAGELAEIQKMADFLNDNDTNFRFKFKAVPWTEDDAAEVDEALDFAVETAKSQVRQAKGDLQRTGKAGKEAAREKVATAEKDLAEAEEKAESDGSMLEPIAFTHWTADGKAVTQYCSEPSGAALEQFMFDYPYSDSPEPNAM